MNKNILLIGFIASIFTLANCSVVLDRSDVKPVPENLQPATSSYKSSASENTTLSSNLMFQLLVGEFALHRGQLDTALENYLAAARTTLNADVAARATKIAEFAQNHKQGLKAAKLWAKAAPSDSDASQNLAILLVRNNHIDAALDQYDQLITLNKDKSAKIFLDIASHMSREKNKEVVLVAMKKIAGKYPNNPHAQLAYAQLASHFNELTQALQAVDKAVVLKTEWPEAIVLRGRILQLQQKHDEFIAYFDKILEGKLKANTDLRKTYARMLIDIQRLEKAFTQYNLLVEALPTDPVILYAASLVALQLKHADHAEKYLSRLIELNERTVDANFYLGQVAELKKQFGKAISRYKSITDGDFYLNAQIRIANILAKQEKYSEALDHVHSIKIKTKQDRLQVYLLEGDIMLEAERYQIAYDVYNRALSELPDDQNLLYARAIAAEKLNKLEAAETDLRKILKIEPNNIQALNALGYTLADRTDRYTEAFDYIQRALTLDSEDAAIIDSMGWVQYRMGNHKEAINYLKRALSLINDAEIAAHLGEVFWSIGNKKEALRVWNKALEESPEDKVIMNIMRRFGL